MILSSNKTRKYEVQRFQIKKKWEENQDWTKENINKYWHDDAFIRFRQIYLKSNHTNEKERKNFFILKNAKPPPKLVNQSSINSRSKHANKFKNKKKKTQNPAS